MVFIINLFDFAGTAISSNLIIEVTIGVNLIVDICYLKPTLNENLRFLH